MILPVSPSPAAVPIQGRSYTKPIIVLIGLAAIVALFLYAARSLRGRTTILDPETLINQGKEFLKEGKFKVAAGKFTEALRCNLADPLRAQTLYQRGFAYASLTSYEKALDDLTNGLKYAFQDQKLRAKLFKVRGDVYFAKDDLEKTLEDYKQGLDCAPPLKLKVEFLIARTDVYLRQQQFELALAATTDVLGIESLYSAKKGAVYLQRGIAQAGRGDNQAAIESFTLALERTSHGITYVVVLYHRASAYARLKEGELAIKDLTTALAIPKDKNSQAELYYLRGCTHSSQKHYKAAIEDFNTACSLSDSSLFDFQIERALAYIGNETPDLAIQEMDQLLEPDNPSENLVSIHLILGRAYAKQNNAVKAIENYTIALELNPADLDKKAELLYFRGIACNEQNNLEVARVDWQAALDCNPSNQDLKKAIEARLAGTPAAT